MVALFVQNDSLRASGRSENGARAATVDTTDLQALMRAAVETGQENDNERATRYATQALKLARRKEDRFAEAKSLNILGLVGLHSANYAEALLSLEQSARIFAEIGERSSQGGALSNIGLIYKRQGRTAQALEYYLRALSVLELGDNHDFRSNVLNNICALYIDRKEYELARKYCEQCLRLRLRVGDPALGGGVLINLGNIHASLGEFDQAKAYYEQCLENQQEIGDLTVISNTLHNLGKLYENSGRYDQAMHYYRESLKIDRERGDPEQESITLTNISKNLLKQAQLPAARQTAAAALAAARSVGAVDCVSGAAGTLAQADSALGDWKSAYEHYKLYKQYSDSLNNESQSKEIGRLEAQYEFDKEIEERERLEAEAAERRQMLYWIAAGVFAALLLVAGLLTWGYRTKQKANKQLGLQNAEILQQSEEIGQQRDELQALNAQITEQRDVLEKAHEEITDSIDYASRIQHALLPSVDAMRQSADVYVYYNARDVVSGDFYWTHQIDKDTALYSAADCTGHGVPGAFMSVLGATTLDTIVRDYGETRPDKMLKLLDQNIRASLKQDENADGSLDGMDLALIKLDKKQNKLYFSSAGRPLFLLRKGEILEYKGAKFPAGGSQHGDKDFPLVEINLETGDRIFMCSDGVTDQFGGPRGRKFSPRRLKETLLAHQDKNLQAQGAAFAEVFDEWQKNAKQLDDQLLIGLGA